MYNKLALSVFFAISLLGFQYSYSQTEKGENILSLSIGPVLPIGSFSSTNPSSQYLGNAKVGETINFSIEHTLSKNSGLIAMLYGQRNGLNTNSLGRQFDETGFWGYNGYAPRYYPNWVVDKKSWSLESLLLGVTKDFPFKTNPKFSFSAKALVGVANVQFPKIYATSKSDTSFAEISLNNASTFGLSYLASVGVKYKLSKKLCLMFSTDYFGTSKIDFGGVAGTIASTNGGLVIPHTYSISNSPGPPAIENTRATEKQPIGTININFGIGMKL
jgi:hypothetical protein